MKMVSYKIVDKNSKPYVQVQVGDSTKVSNLSSSGILHSCSHSHGVTASSCDYQWRH